ncbi:hypothetical protein SAMN06265348_10179 [Pedobacter westerhofensis]|uniref:Uncharacterized protein n=1 Tax=Pedobacter westerhofensis TaxID=425512 RepID=A0A521ADW4_9SPHI|nr:hypothetical protein SAMN06265348_10179 [Pedobacter westerhofensis]
MNIVKTIFYFYEIKMNFKIIKPFQKVKLFLNKTLRVDQIC